MRIETVKLGPIRRPGKEVLCLKLPSDSFQQSPYLSKSSVSSSRMRLIWCVGGYSEFLNAVVELLIGGGDESRDFSTSFLS